MSIHASILFSLIMGILAIGNDEMVSAAGAFTSTCVGQAGHIELKNYYRVTAVSIFPAASVLLYLLVWLQYKRKQTSVGVITNGTEQKRELKIQRKVTVSIGICV